MSAAHWRAFTDHDSAGRPDVRFAAHEGFPRGILIVKTGRAVLQNFNFRNGTIEYDMKSLSEDIPGIQFRRRGPENAPDAEEFYVRTFPDCRASDDCVQYAPVIHGFMLWNAYPQYQARAFILPGWNHIKLVVSGRRMNVYINGLPEPALTVGQLEGSNAEGGLAFRGPAFYANLVVTPNAVQGLPPSAAPDPTAEDRGLVRRWQLGPLTTPHYGRAPAYAEMPADPHAWRPIAAGRFGLVSVARAFPLSANPPQLTWLRFHVTARAATTRQVSLGWLGQVWVFVNGQQAAEGKNFYYPESERRAPDGRLSLENGSFPVQLHAGENEVVLALYESAHDNDTTVNFYGWGAEMRFADSAGLTLKP